jgi:TDG/mug DNA glycosylase family protein
MSSLSMTEPVKQGLPPVGAAEPRLLILGSLPGEASLAAQRYYAHPRNGFWQLLGGVLGEPLQDLSYDERLERLEQRGVALWDVVHAARRRGSLDQQLREIETRDLRAFVAKRPSLRGIAFNGGMAAAIGERQLAGLAISTLALPSSSPAYTLSLAEKAARWAALAAFLD